jgi:hypothetical protein
VAPTADRPPGSARDSENGTHDDRNNADRPNDRDLCDEANNEKNYPKNDHDASLTWRDNVSRE